MKTRWLSGPALLILLTGCVDGIVTRHALGQSAGSQGTTTGTVSTTGGAPSAGATSASGSTGRGVSSGSTGRGGEGSSSGASGGSTSGGSTASTGGPVGGSFADGGIHYDANSACINGTLYTNDVLPAGEGEFGTHGLDRSWWTSARYGFGGDYTGFQTAWGRLQYDTYFGDHSDGLPGGHDPFAVLQDTGAPGSPMALRISAMPMPADLVGNAAVGGKDYYAGCLDQQISLQYGFFVARVRTPAPSGGLSPAFWMLTYHGVGMANGSTTNGEWDIQEMFGNVNWYASANGTNGMNSGEILWSSAPAGDKGLNWGGTFGWPSWESSPAPSADYHDYGVLLEPGGAAIGPLDGSQPPQPITNGPTTEGYNVFLDGVPLPGHTGGADLTQGSAQKEIMAMFQVGPPGAGQWLGDPTSTTWPQSYWIQWIRVYRPTAMTCR